MQRRLPAPSLLVQSARRKGNSLIPNMGAEIRGGEGFRTMVHSRRYVGVLVRASQPIEPSDVHEAPRFTHAPLIA